MARPNKQGVDYFPLDVHMDNKFKFVEIKFGLEGFAAVIKIMQNIYAEGYWSKWEEDEKLLFSSENNIDFDKLEAITDECTKRGIFNADLYEKYNILTSTGIQKRYKEIVRRRKDVKVKEEYLLIDGLSGVNDDINPQGDDINDDIKTTYSKHDDVKSTQRKGNRNRNRKNTKKPSRHKYEICDMENAKLLLKLIKQNNPTAKEPNIESWANDMRLLRENDEREDKHIKWLINWSQQDDFWMTNILSARSLRSQWDQLVMKARREYEQKQQLKLGTGKSSKSIDWEDA